MGFRLLDPAAVVAGKGSHPAASPFDKRLTVELGLTAFEVYQVELPADEHSVPHTHTADGVEDMYAIVAGSGWAIIDGEEIAVCPGQFVAVTLESTRYLKAGPDGLAFIAVCSSG